MSVPNFHRKCNIYVSRLIMCTVFCGNLCALFSNVCGDKNGFVVYNRFTGTERPTYSVSIFMTSKGVAICAFEGVCITGGEPLVNKNVDDFARRIKDMGYLVKLDTNGTFPDKLRALIDAGLVDYVAMDIKNSPEKYAETVGLEKFDMEPIFESVRLLMGGETDFEFRTTVVRELHSAEDFEKIGEWLKGDEKYFLQSFTDSDFVLQKGLSAHSRETLRTFADIVRKNVPRVEIRGV